MTLSLVLNDWNASAVCLCLRLCLLRSVRDYDRVIVTECLSGIPGIRSAITRIILTRLSLIYIGWAERNYCCLYRVGLYQLPDFVGEFDRS